MRKVAVLFLLLALVACGGGGGGGSTSEPPGSYIGFTEEDFSDKTMYFVDGTGYSKAVFHKNGTIQAYSRDAMPYQNARFEEGFWSVTDGRLEIARVDSPDDKTFYTLINDDVMVKYFKASRFYPASIDGEVINVGIFYSQIIGLMRAMEFVANHEQP